MAYIFRFNDNDKVVNLVKTNPRVSFYFYSGSAYFNNQYAHSGAFSASILGVPSGYASLYEQNIDTSGSINFQNTTVLLGGAAPTDPFGYAVSQQVDPTQYYTGPNPAHVTFKIKDGTRVNFKTVSKAEFNLEAGGAPLYNEGILSASVQKYYYSATTLKTSGSYLDTDDNTEYTGSVTYLAALKSTLNYYTSINPNYMVSSSTRDLTCSVEANGALDVGLVTIPSIFYGASVQKGSVNLRFYITGTLIGELQDITRNGDLVQVGPFGSPGSGTVAGTILYNEGFLILTGSTDLSNGTNTDDFGTDKNFPTWVNFAQTISASAPIVTGSSFFLGFSGSHKIPVITLFAHAGKGDLNHSNNRTYVDKNTQIVLTSGSTGYIQNPEALVKNVVSSSYLDPTGSFTKTTYISKIGIYDKNKNLIAIAKMATPVKKTPSRDFTFKIKFDV
tara:strand:+ start:1273 stop:2610 length:1338 start_codon:yes stop_codon:yes gene_type:complete